MNTVHDTSLGPSLHRVTDEGVITRLQDTLKFLICMDHKKQFVFPGPQPVSIERKDLPGLLQKEYVVCEKTDGVRGAMMFFRIAFEDGANRKICCIFDRKGACFLCGIQKVPRQIWQGTVFDGEVTTYLPTGEPVFLIFDAVRIAGFSVTNMPFLARLQAIKESLQQYEATHPSDQLGLRVKRVITVADFDKIDGLLHLKQKEYRTDGILLVPNDRGVTFGRCFNMYKLKPEGMHTVDFMVSGKRQEKAQLSVYDPGKKKQTVVATLDIKEEENLVKGSVVECSYSHTCQKWTYVMQRDDKTCSNDLLTFKKTMLNAKEGLTVQDITAVLEKCISTNFN